jgi:uncharacterized membrane protein YfcA
VTIAGLPLLAAIACALVVYVGTIVQASLGIGLGMLSSPVLALVDPDFIPVAIMISVIPLSGSVAWSERESVDRQGAGLLLVGRIPGVIVGVLVVSSISDTVLGLLVAGSVIGAVIVSAVGRKFVAGPTTLLVAGGASGFMGTTTGVGGPPVALTYQHDTPETMRATISTFFAVGAVMSLVGLMLAGEVSRRSLELTALLIPSVVLGIITARRIKHRLNADLVRPAVLMLCLLSATALLIRTII